MNKKKIFFACDFSNQIQTIELLEQIKDFIYGIKIGLQYITKNGVEGIKTLSKFNLPIFYDGKFFDIKNTVLNGTRSLEGLGVSYASVHLLNGEDTLTQAVEVASKISVNLIGVSVLTSFENSDLQSLGFSDTVEKQIERLIKIAAKVKLHGVVCSPHEVKIVKKISPKLICFTPGIRLDKNINDQKRTLSAKEALNQGSDFLIIGRPIYKKGDPIKNIKKILNTIE